MADKSRDKQKGALLGSLEDLRLNRDGTSLLIKNPQTLDSAWLSRQELFETHPQQTKKCEKSYFMKKLSKTYIKLIEKEVKNIIREKEVVSDSEVDRLTDKLCLRTKRLKHKNFFFIPRDQRCCSLKSQIQAFPIPPMLKLKKRWNKTGLAFDIDCMYHFGNPEEPENPERYEACLDILTKTGLKNYCFPVVSHYSSYEIERLLRLVHTKDHVRDLINLGKNLGHKIVKSNNSDSFYESVFSTDALYHSVAQSVTLCEHVFNGHLQNGLCLIRPPGHHCDFDRKYGFCHINNIAVAAKRLLEKNPKAKILIFDWDLHHGNGTEDIFYDEHRVVYISVHQEYDINGKPMFPGTGSIADVGGRSARGRNVNIPVPIGSGDREYRSLLDLIVSPILREFEPDVVLVSAGFDSNRGDPLGLLELTPPMFGYITSRFMRETPSGKVLLFLEGGYNPKIVSECVSNCVAALLGHNSDFKARESVELDFLIGLDNIIKAQRVYWKSLYVSKPLSPFQDRTAGSRRSRHRRINFRSKKLIALKRFRETHPDEPGFGFEASTESSDSGGGSLWAGARSFKAAVRASFKRQVIDLTVEESSFSMNTVGKNSQPRLADFLRPLETSFGQSVRCLESSPTSEEKEDSNGEQSENVIVLD